MSNFRSVACQTDSNLIDKLITFKKDKSDILDDDDLYKDYVRSAQCSQFWPLDKNPIRGLVPTILGAELPEQHLRNESLMFDLVQAITNDGKLVNLLAKYIHHIVPNVIISKRTDLIPLIICSIRVCADTEEQERLMSLLFNLIKRPNKEQRRMILSGIIVVLQVSPQHSSQLLLPNLWDYVNDKFAERRILLAESCSSLAHYVRPVMRTNLILTILMQLMKDKDVAVKATACKSFACLLTLVMDRNDEVFDAVAGATEDTLTDVLQTAPVDYCENRQHFEQMRFCVLETIYPLVCMWAVKLNRFKQEIAEFYIGKAAKYFKALKLRQASLSPNDLSLLASRRLSRAIPEDHRRGSVFVKSSSNQYSNLPYNQTQVSTQIDANNNQVTFTSDAFSASRRQSTYPTVPNSFNDSNHNQESDICTKRVVSAYLKMINYATYFVFSDAVNGCVWLSKYTTTNSTTELFEKPLKLKNKLLNPTLIIDESAVAAFHDQCLQAGTSQQQIIDSLGWVLEKYLVQYFVLLNNFSSPRFCSVVGMSGNQCHEYVDIMISSFSQISILFGKQITKSKLRPLIKNTMTSQATVPLFGPYVGSLVAFEPVEQAEFEEAMASLRFCLFLPTLTRTDIEIIGTVIKIVATNQEYISSPSVRQKFLTYIMDVLISYSNTVIHHNINNKSGSERKISFTVSNRSRSKSNAKSEQQSKEFILILFKIILSCLIDPEVRPPDWASLLASKFLPLLVSLANDSSNVYVCTCARLMCAQLVDTFDNYLNSPYLTQKSADAILPALESLQSLTDQIKASNLRRQIDSLVNELKDKFFPQKQE